MHLALSCVFYFLILLLVHFYPVCLRTTKEQTTNYGNHKWIESGIFWNREVEKEFRNSVVEQPDLTTSGKSIVKLSAGCGRPFNMIAKLSDGTSVCFRYRPNLEQIQGEMYSYYLGRLLGIKNLVNTKLLRFSSTDMFWTPIFQQLVNTSWEEGHLVVMTHYEETAKPTYVPKMILKDSFMLTGDKLATMKIHRQDLLKLLQWSELTIFDYLIGNFDRVVSSMYNQQWHKHSMEDPINNLITNYNGLWYFIDNEDGLLHAYRLIEKYEPYLRKTIDNFCIFRQETIENIHRLLAMSEEQLWSLIWEHLHKDNQKYYIYLPKMPSRYMKILKSRLNYVTNHIRRCRTRFTEEKEKHL